MNSDQDKLFEIMDSMSGNYARLEYKLKVHYPLLYQAILSHWSYTTSPKNFMERCYQFIHNESIICDLGNCKKFEFFKTGYKSCSRGCPCAISKYKASMLANHGVESPQQSNNIREKTRSTFQKKYNVDKLSDINVEQKKSTNIEKYGVEYPLQNPMIREKTANSLERSTGFKTNFKNPNIQKLIQDNWVIRNEGSQKSYVRTVEDGDQYSKEYASKHFKGNWHVLFDSEGLRSELIQKSRNELALELNCSPSLIDRRIDDFDLNEFRNIPSYYETLISEYLTNLSVKFVTNTRKIIPPKELDFYIQSHNLAIEFCGLRWHGELAGRGKNYHLDKLHNCRKLGIDLIQIFQDEWDNNSKLIKDIIATKLGHNEHIIYARKTTIRKITGSEASNFLSVNHLQGVGNGAQYHYGLFYNERLISVMTFIWKRDIWELKRYATLPGVRVIGGAGKLFKSFLKEIDPISILSYCDLRYFKGSVYKALGFEYIKDTTPGYHYTKGVVRYNRLSFTKSKLINEGYDTSLTEAEIMNNRGFDKIWDCGHSKWIWNKGL